MSPMKCMIAAISDNMAIGVKGDLPWHISEDLKYFKSVTRGCPVIMGRTTYESIGRPLPGRRNIVLSRSDMEIDGVELVHSLEQAYALTADAEKVFIIGGASIYKAAISDADCLYITEVHTEIEDADAFFPSIDPSTWERESLSSIQTDPETGYDFEFVVFTRRS